MFGRLSLWMLLAALALGLIAPAAAEEKLKALIVDGQNNHDWRSTTPVLRQALEQSDRFTIDVATSPEKGQDMRGFQPEFAKYDVVVSNYNGDRWSKETEQALLDYVKGGGGFVVIHAANNAFGDWEEYNRMIGLGGWGGRNERSGPYVYFKNDQEVRDEAPGGGGSHGPQHEFPIVVRDAKHPITRDMPTVWMHAKDELYTHLRGPGENMKILATAYAEGDKGRGVHEPMMMTIAYGDGRVFHTPMGHADYSMQDVGFYVTLQRGAEWAATGEVTIPIPDNFPTADAVSVPE